VARNVWDRDLRAALTACVSDVTRSVVRAPERSTLVRLLMTEAPHFPALIGLLHTREIAPLLAAPLAELTAAGRLSAANPLEAAEHLAALTFGQVNTRSLLGTVPLSDDETDRLLDSGVGVFLRAYQSAR
jgi:TetR/AcrR family transcriptional repressor of mexJK operon